MRSAGGEAATPSRSHGDPQLKLSSQHPGNHPRNARWHLLRADLLNHGLLYANIATRVVGLFMRNCGSCLIQDITQLFYIILGRLIHFVCNEIQLMYIFQYFLSSIIINPIELFLQIFENPQLYCFTCIQMSKLFKCFVYLTDILVYVKNM